MAGLIYVLYFGQSRKPKTTGQRHDHFWVPENCPEVSIKIQVSPRMTWWIWNNNHSKNVHRQRGRIVSLYKHLDQNRYYLCFVPQNEHSLGINHKIKCLLSDQVIQKFNCVYLWANVSPIKVRNIKELRYRIYVLRIVGTKTAKKLIYLQGTIEGHA